MDIREHTFAFIDTETTGGSAMYDRVIEIGVLIVEKGQVVKKWATLLNPERSISPFITGITGITTSDVRDAPTFASISSELFELLDGKIFVAHNARFDYGFIKNEFKRDGKSFSAKTLCTARLSRALYPRFKSHKLDSIIERFGFDCENRHRAFDDAKVMVDFFFKAKEDRGDEQFDWAVKSLLKQPTLPSNLTAATMDAVPDGTGVYLFYGKGDKPIYIGKSVNLRNRVLSHFSGDHENGKDMKISGQLRKIDFRETVGELGALLLEASLIKTHSPLYNVKLRKYSSQCAFQLRKDANGIERVHIVKSQDITPDAFDSLFGAFRTEKNAKLCLNELAEIYSLCPKILGIESNLLKGACFSYHLKKCKGICAEEETAVEHNIRLRMALSSMKHTLWPFNGRIGVRERDVITDEAEIHLFDNWCFLGTYRTEQDLFDACDGNFELQFDVDMYRIIAAYLKKMRMGKKKSSVAVDIIDLPRPSQEYTAPTRSKKKAGLMFKTLFA